MEFVPIEPNIEVSGKMVQAIVEGFGAFTILASQALAREKLGTTNESGLAVVEREQWYPQAAWLRAFEHIGKSMGDQMLFQLGESMARKLTFPEGVNDLPGALKFVDIVFHMNHRKRGREMFSPGTGTMIEGIGHYGQEPAAGKNTISCTCNTSNPCAFDRGVIQGLARRFVPLAQVSHDDARPCRKTGAPSCSYVISWG